MKLSGQAICHKTFGCGIVTELAGSTITVCFPDGEKKFIYPDAFKDYLVLRDTKLQEKIQALIAQKEAEAEKRRQIAHQEQSRRLKLLNFTVTANSHAAFDIAPEELDRVCQTFTVFSGRYLSGGSKGQPRILEKLKPNSLCLLTHRPAGKPEQARAIIGAFMVREDFFGEDALDGFVLPHSEHRFLLPEGASLLFWEQLGQQAPSRWGSTAFRYCSVTDVYPVLCRMVKLFNEGEGLESALAFYQYFCRMNRLNPLLRLMAKKEAVS